MHIDITSIIVILAKANTMAVHSGQLSSSLGVVLETPPSQQEENNGHVPIMILDSPLQAALNITQEDDDY